MTSASEASALLSADAVRARCAIVSEAVKHVERPDFSLVSDRLDQVVRRVVDVTRRRYPDLAVPYHSRWRHFSVGGVDRAALVAPGVDAGETARARIDLAIVSVLLDAGAGSHWRYREAETGQPCPAPKALPWRAFALCKPACFPPIPRPLGVPMPRCWREITPEDLARAFQHAPGNELVGVEGRALLLRRLGQVCAASPCSSARRLGSAGFMIIGRRALSRLPPPWCCTPCCRRSARSGPAGSALRGVPLGDCGRHSAIPGDGLVPFHKLSQWLAYSLIEPLEAGGVRVIELDGLTGLAEYRNGGLFLDCGVIVPRDPGLLRRPLDALSEPVVEWRALTVTLLDRLAVLVRESLGKSADEFPLARVLEGGSWAAGREIAFERRPTAVRRLRSSAMAPCSRTR